MGTTGNYIISGGAQGKSRLNILSAILHDTTKALLELNGVLPGSTFLDAGCGGGNVARMVAEMTGDTGQVTAIDFDSGLIALNREEAVAAGVTNLNFQAMSAYDIPYSNVYDVAYSRFLLSHLNEPARVLDNLVRSVKPGGRVVVEDVQFSGHFCYPASAAFDRYIGLYSAAAKLRGQNPEIGPSLYRLFIAAGLKDVNFDIIQPAFNKGDGKWMAQITLERIIEPVTGLGLADEKELSMLLQQLADFTKDESTIISLPRIFRVWGTKQ